MSTKLLILMVFAACAAPPGAVETVQQETGGTWGACQRNYPCQPGTAWSVVICNAVCGSDGGYCDPYTWLDEQWCYRSPMAIENGRIICDQYGDPVWPTRCLPYVMP